MDASQLAVAMVAVLGVVEGSYIRRVEVRYQS